MDEFRFYVFLATLVLTHVSAALAIGRWARRLEFQIRCIGAQILPCLICGKVAAGHTSQEAATCGRAHKRRMALEREAAKAR